MKDRETGTIWTHMDGKAVEGPLKGQRLKFIPSPHITWADWKADYPNTKVLSPNTPFTDRYLSPLRIGVYNPSEANYGDKRLPSNALVIGIEINAVFKAYHLAELKLERGVVNDTVADKPIVVIYNPNTQTGLAYLRLFDNQTLEFYNPNLTGSEIRDRETNSLWDVHGRGIEGVFKGAKLDFVPSFISEWYGWSGYHTGTQLYMAGQKHSD